MVGARQVLVAALTRNESVTAKQTTTLPHPGGEHRRDWRRAALRGSPWHLRGAVALARELASLCPAGVVVSGATAFVPQLLDAFFGVCLQSASEDDLIVMVEAVLVRYSVLLGDATFQERVRRTLTTRLMAMFHRERGTNAFFLRVMPQLLQVVECPSPDAVKLTQTCCWLLGEYASLLHPQTHAKELALLYNTLEVATFEHISALRQTAQHGRAVLTGARSVRLLHAIVWAVTKVCAHAPLFKRRAEHCFEKLLQELALHGDRDLESVAIRTKECYTLLQCGSIAHELLNTPMDTACSKSAAVLSSSSLLCGAWDVPDILHANDSQSETDNSDGSDEVSHADMTQLQNDFMQMGLTPTNIVCGS